MDQAGDRVFIGYFMFDIEVFKLNLGDDMGWRLMVAACCFAPVFKAQAGFLYLSDEAVKPAAEAIRSETGRMAEPARPVAAPSAVAVESPRQDMLRLSPGRERISSALRAYAKENGWVLAWELDRDFPIDYPAVFKGSFLDVMEQVAKSLQNTDTPVRIKAYEANRVIRVIHATR
ncbi:toxin co-regulated pilus biosynthesis Q family protein [Chromobacterium sp. IIBBL 290-4]|uniref:toxin co-regulated pilus biosynthesis Q family protein n=1 Tax=Chromobacterium sp. IIBBL 290-4 TaxID=2953890 RepID=UPI0020B6DC04|nr:toxin co-regulated pilus biosynthesis Q family protein [Chromobacterium sp. IIBBL 290-4]UTH74139.1 toxin co-regulated pilus biosynthesis Q family protein [Chromobacterium sp. IIBBL 290-4]